MINYLAPPNIRQKAKNWTPWINRDLRAQIRTNNNVLTEAINGNPQKWVEFRNTRNKIFKDLNKAKSEYLKRGFLNNKSKWTQINKVVQKEPLKMPKMLIFEGKVFN